MFPTSFSILFPLETFYTAPCTPPWQSINHPHPTHQPPLLQHHVAFSIKACIKNINQQKFAILHCGIMKTTTVQMFIMILLTQTKKLPLKKIKSLKVKQVHFSFVENRQNTEHGVLEKASWEHAGDSLDLILIDPSNSGRIFIIFVLWAIAVIKFVYDCNSLADQNSPVSQFSILLGYLKHIYLLPWYCDYVVR